MYAWGQSLYRKSQTSVRAVLGRQTKISLRPGVLQWDRERARVSRDELARKMQVKVDRVVEWEEIGNISASQADRLAKRTHTSLICLSLRRPRSD